MSEAKLPPRMEAEADLHLKRKLKKVQFIIQEISDTAFNSCLLCLTQLDKQSSITFPEHEQGPNQIGGGGAAYELPGGKGCPRF